MESGAEGDKGDGLLLVSKDRSPRDLSHTRIPLLDTT